MQEIFHLSAPRVLPCRSSALHILIPCQDVGHGVNHFFPYLTAHTRPKSPHAIIPLAPTPLPSRGTCPAARNRTNSASLPHAPGRTTQLRSLGRTTLPRTAHASHHLQHATLLPEDEGSWYSLRSVCVRARACMCVCVCACACTSRRPRASHRQERGAAAGEGLVPA